MKKKKHVSGRLHCWYVIAVFILQSKGKLLIGAIGFNDILHILYVNLIFFNFGQHKISCQIFNRKIWMHKTKNSQKVYLKYLMTDYFMTISFSRNDISWKLQKKL